jgi:hypothetical protein
MATFSGALKRFRVFLDMGKPPLEIVAYSSALFFPFRLKQNKTDNTEEMKQKILAFGVKKLDVPDAHLYFQAPGGQVFRLVGINEDLSMYEGSPSSRPGSSASAS